MGSFCTFARNERACNGFRRGLGGTIVQWPLLGHDLDVGLNLIQGFGLYLLNCQGQIALLSLKPNKDIEKVLFSIQEAPGSEYPSLAKQRIETVVVDYEKKSISLRANLRGLKKGVLRDAGRNALKFLELLMISLQRRSTPFYLSHDIYQRKACYTKLGRRRRDPKNLCHDSLNFEDEASKIVAAKSGEDVPRAVNSYIDNDIVLGIQWCGASECRRSYGCANVA